MSLNSIISRLALCACLLGLASCQSGLGKALGKAGAQTLRAGPGEISGTYRNRVMGRESILPGSTLWARLTGASRDLFASEDLVRIEAKGSSVVASITQKGRVRETIAIPFTRHRNHLSLPSKFSGAGLQVLTAVSRSRAALGINRKRNLILASSWGGTAVFVILPIFGADGHGFSEYERLR